MKAVKNLIFDYGNVIFEIDFQKTQAAFAALGISHVDHFFAHKGHHPLFDQFETGALSPAAFRAGIREAARQEHLSDAQIDAAWNSLLIGVSGNNHQVLLQAKATYRTFLLSNNNAIHYQWIINYLQTHFGIADYSDYFEKAYFSHLMGLRKPHRAIFERVIAENQLDPTETLFIDDSPQHIAGAQEAGLQTLLMDVHPAKLAELLHQQQLL